MKEEQSQRSIGAPDLGTEWEEKKILGSEEIFDDEDVITVILELELETDMGLGID